MGTSNLAARRGAKANRRKAIVAQKRKIEALEASSGAQALRASVLPIRYCLLSENIAEAGMGSLVLMRGNSVGPVFFTGFLLDTFCHGVKNTMSAMLEQEQVEVTLAKLEASQPLVTISPICARKLLHDLVEWSGSFGMRPHRDYPALERLFGDVDASQCGCEYEFGIDGKPLYVNGPYDTLMQSRGIVERLNQQLGPEGFNYLIGSPS